MATDTGDRTFTIPEAPAIPGLRFRHYRGPADHPAMLDVRNAAHLAGGLNDLATLEGMDVWYAGLTNCDPEEDRVLVELGGRLVAYGRTWWADRTSGERAFEAYCFIDTTARGRGIGTALLRAYHEMLDETHGLPAFLEASDLRTRQIYLRHGYVDHGPPIQLPDGGPKMYPMWREGRRRSSSK